MSITSRPLVVIAHNVRVSSCAASLQHAVQGVKEEPCYMTSSVIDMQQQELEQDDRLLCIRILNVDCDEVYTTTTTTTVSTHITTTVNGC
jgi:hypothetical protein